MARLFLSYAREDRHLVEPLAALLEQAGHHVWWDRRITGGADFTAEIAGALATSDVVLVAWSSAAVASHWVKDEAAEGRDRGRLVPLLFDAVLPPLGFRQIHSVSLAGWNGGGQPPAFGDLLRAIESVARSPDQFVSQALAPPSLPPGIVPTPAVPVAPLVPQADPAFAPQPAYAEQAKPFPYSLLFLVAGLGLIAFLLLRQPATEPATNVMTGPGPVAPVVPPVTPPVTQPPPAAAAIDGRWRLSWSSNGANYDGLLAVQGSAAQFEVHVTSSLGDQSVRQDCTIGGSGPYRVTCGNVQVISGATGYLPDSFTLEQNGEALTGSTTDPVTGAAVPVSVQRE